MLARRICLVVCAGTLIACGDDGGSADTSSSTATETSGASGNDTITTLPVTSETLDTTISASDGTSDEGSTTGETSEDDTSGSGDDSSPVCGDGTIEAGEDCEGDDLGGQTCASQGFLRGELGCTNTCTFDTSGCIPDTSLDVEFCRLQYPLEIVESVGTVVVVYGRVYVAGVTDQSSGNDPVPELIGYVGYGPEGSNPSIDDTGWTWIEAEPNPGYDDQNPFGEPNNDEYWVDLTVPAPGVYAFAFRFSGDAGQTFVHCDGDDPGNTNGYDPAEAGHMTSTPR